MKKRIICIFLFFTFSGNLFPDITSELLLAIRTNDFKYAEILIKNGAPLNGDTWATNPLYAAIEQDNFQMFMLLLYHHADLSVVLDIPYFGKMSIAEYALECGSNAIAFICKETSGRFEQTRKIIEAITENNYEMLKRLSIKGQELNEPVVFKHPYIWIPDYITIFDYAVYVGDEKMVKLLIDCDTEKNIKYGVDALELAIYSENFKMIELLLINGSYSRFPLDTAAVVGNTDVIRLLLDHGANPDELYLNGHSATDIALKNGNAEAALMLLLYETALSAKLKEMYRAIYDHDTAEIQKLADGGFEINQGRITPLAWAAYLGKGDLVKLLLEYGAIVQDEEKRLDSSPVFLAAITGHKDIIRVLLEKGALVDSCDEYGWSLLHQAVQNEQPDLVELLLKHKAELIHAVSPEEVCGGILCLPDSPLHLAAVLENLDVLKTFIRNNVPMDYLGRNRQTPLHFAAGVGRLEAVRFLSGNDANINAKTGWGMTPLHMAAKNGNMHIITYLIEKGANVDVADDDGRTPLFCTLENGHPDAAVLLIKTGADIKKVINCRVYHDELTLLHLVSKAGYTESVKFFLTHGADVNSLDKDNISPLHLAVYYDHYEIAELLIAHGANINIITVDFDNRYIWLKKEFSPLDLAPSFKIWKLLYEAGARPGAE